jgi:hypothetical protein
VGVIVEFEVLEALCVKVDVFVEVAVGVSVVVVGADGDGRFRVTCAVLQNA